MSINIYIYIYINIIILHTKKTSLKKYTLIYLLIL